METNIHYLFHHDERLQDLLFAEQWKVEARIAQREIQRLQNADTANLKEKQRLQRSHERRKQRCQL